MIGGSIAAIVTAIALYLIGVPLALGAHPIWAVKVISIGAPMGLFSFWVLLKFNKTALALLSGAGLVAAFAAAKIGRTRFGASYGDDVVAGQMWYFGWIGVCVFATLFAAAAVQWVLSNRSSTPQ